MEKNAIFRSQRDVRYVILFHLHVSDLEFCYFPQIYVFGSTSFWNAEKSRLSHIQKCNNSLNVCIFYHGD